MTSYVIMHDTYLIWHFVWQVLVCCLFVRRYILLFSDYKWGASVLLYICSYILLFLFIGFSNTSFREWIKTNCFLFLITLITSTLFHFQTIPNYPRSHLHELTLILFHFCTIQNVSNYPHSRLHQLTLILFHFRTIQNVPNYPLIYITSS